MIQEHASARYGLAVEGKVKPSNPGSGIQTHGPARAAKGAVSDARQVLPVAFAARRSIMMPSPAAAARFLAETR